MDNESFREAGQKGNYVTQRCQKTRRHEVLSVLVEVVHFWTTREEKPDSIHSVNHLYQILNGLSFTSQRRRCNHPKCCTDSKGQCELVP